MQKRPNRDVNDDKTDDELNEITKNADLLKHKDKKSRPQNPVLGEKSSMFNDKQKPNDNHDTDNSNKPKTP